MLLKNDAVARQTVDQATATYETSKSQVEVAKAALIIGKTDLSYAYHNRTVYRSHRYITGKDGRTG
jgi:hypothetical protein